MAKRRTFTPEFKAEVVLEVLSDATTQAEVCRWRTKSQRKSTLTVEATVA